MGCPIQECGVSCTGVWGVLYRSVGCPVQECGMPCTGVWGFLYRSVGCPVQECGVPFVQDCVIKFDSLPPLHNTYVYLHTYLHMYMYVP